MTPAAEPATPRPAATVVLMRAGARHDSHGIEVLMLQRGQGARFMPGVWVFPGGVVEEADVQAAGEGATLDSERAHRICGAREVAEEASIEIAAEDLLPWSRVITPETVPMRFDTRFYVAKAPPHARPEPEPAEMDDARWLSPRKALAAAERGEMEISFPTMRHLEQLESFERISDVLEAAEGRDPEAILPRLRNRDGKVEVLLPGEDGYEEASPAPG